MGYKSVTRSEICEKVIVSKSTDHLLAGNLQTSTN